MPTCTTPIGIILMLLGFISCLFSFEVTALIPSFFGLSFVMLGVVSQKFIFQRYGIMIATVLALIGVLAPALSLFSDINSGDFSLFVTFRFLVMMFLCLFFLIQSAKRIKFTPQV